MEILKFGSDGCVGCITMKPRFKEIEKENPSLKTTYIDGDENIEMMEKYGIHDLPTFIFLDKNGEEIERMQGIIEKAVLLEKIQALQNL